jgi:pimeloyl-ACP methyl ester carboxylesterase
MSRRVLALRCNQVRQGDRRRPRVALSKQWMAGRMVYGPRMVPKDVAARGARIRFVEAGDGNAGVPVVLLHDCAATHATFAKVIERLAADFRVIAPDLPGFGGSEKPDPQKYAYGFDAFSESVFDLVAALGLGRVHVCGHGLGGAVALTLAARHPSLVHRLVLVDTAVYAAREHALARAGRMPVVGDLLFRQLMGHALFRAYVTGSVYAGATGIPAGRLDHFYKCFNVPEARQALHATVTATTDTRPLVARLPRVNAEALVVWGRDDRVAPVEHGRRLARELRARFEVLECGRCPPDELPDQFASVLSSFLAAPSPRPSLAGTKPRSRPVSA